jgi:hypothetical protein
MLAGALAVCQPSEVLAKPKRPAAAQPTAPQPAADNVENIEATQQALMDRIRELEIAQTRLLELVKQTSTATETPPPVVPQEQKTTSLEWLLGGIAVFSSALCVILFGRTRRYSAANTTSSFLGRDTVLALGSETGTEQADAAPAQNCSIPPPLHPFVPALPDWDPASPALDAKAARLPGLFDAPTRPRPYDPTIELAEIMLSFGRVNSAAEALESYLEHNPKEAVSPWLKLLEVYRESGQRAEFDRVAHELNKTFNVWAVDWDNFEDACDPKHGLEEAHHIVERLQHIWGTRECQAYLQYLLRDTRAETRHGFSLTAIDDILNLAAVLENDLGPYTGPVDMFSDAPPDNSPPTETDGDESILPSQPPTQPAATTQAVVELSETGSETKPEAEKEPEAKPAPEPEPEPAQEPEAAPEATSETEAAPTPEPEADKPAAAE